MNFNDGCKITQASLTSVVITVENQTVTYSEENKPVFRNDRGESVIEYTGLATTGETECSWAIAKFEPKGSSLYHYHQDHAETFYILYGKAIILIDEQEHILTASDHIKINRGQRHQVINISEDEQLVLIAKCEPAWSHQDVHFVNLPE